MGTPRSREDFGLFGPQSVTWKVWTAPTALIGFKRAIVVESFDPFLAAAVEDQNGVRRDPYGRMDRTGLYFQTVAVGDSRTAIRASETLFRVHARVVGTEPISGLPYSANSPETQLWIHITGWHSVLLAYETYGPGPLSSDEESQYWAECARAAELQTCDPARVPRSRAELRGYYQTVRPRLCMSEHARSLVHYFLYPPLPLLSRDWMISRLVAPATVDTMPRWMSDLAGLNRSSPAIRCLVHTLLRAFMKLITPLPARLRAVDQVMPSIRPLWEAAFGSEPPLRNEIRSPQEARELYSTQQST